MTQPSGTSLKRKHYEMESISTDDLDNCKGICTESPPSKKPRHDENNMENDETKHDSNITKGNTAYSETKRQQRKREISGFTQNERNVHKKKRKKQNKRKRTQEMLDSMTEEQRAKYSKDKWDQRTLKREQKEIQSKKLMEASKNGMKICIDLYFNKHFNKNMEYTNIVKQLCYCWNANKLAKNAASLHLINVDQHWNEYFETQGIVSWKGIHIHQNKDILESFPDENKQTFMYLTPDSDNILDEEEFNKNKNSNIYIIGAIADRVIVPNLTLNRAKELGIRHCKLPLNRLKELDGRHCLNVNAVFNMLLRFQEEESWYDIMQQEIPNRNRKSTKTKEERRKPMKTSTDNS